MSRFDAAAGEKKFLHPMVREGVIAEFIRAAEDPGNKGRGDREIFENITKDKDYFASENPLSGGMGPMGGGEILDDADARAVMGLPPKK